MLTGKATEPNNVCFKMVETCEQLDKLIHDSIKKSN